MKFWIVLWLGLVGLHQTAEAALPRNLSDWQIFDYDPIEQTFKLHKNHSAYQLKATLFTDRASKFRTVMIPKGAEIEIVDGEMRYPVGTVISKTFSYPATMLEEPSETLSGPWGVDHKVVETRILVHEPQGWIALPYLWNAASKDAKLKVTGQRVPLSFKEYGPLTYIVPNKNQCAGCHVKYDEFAKDIMPIGPVQPGNMDRNLELYLATHADDYGQNQLALFQKKGWLTQIQRDSFQRWVDPFDQDQSLDERARSYLAINCAHCHAPDGPASTSGLYLGLTTPEGPSLGICKIPVAAGRGSGGRPFNIVPGDPDQSILLFRMESQESDIQMPELGRGLVDTDALGLVSDWITSLTPGVCSP